MRKLLAIGTMLCLLAAGGLAVGEEDTLILPPQLTEIGEEAWAGDTSIQAADLGSALTAIGPRAFQGCENLREVHIPDTIQSLGADCFDGCAEDLLIVTDSVNAAMEYARANAIDYQAGTTYRALLVGQSYPEAPENNQLSGAQDAANVAAALQAYATTDYQVSIRSDLTCAGIVSAIYSVLGAAGPQDVSLFYYSGHGSTDGDLIGTEYFWEEDLNDIYGGYLTVSQLRNALDAVPGRKIVIVDCCYSGKLVAPSTGGMVLQAPQERQDPRDFVHAFTGGFGLRSRGNLAVGGYYVMTACAEDEESFESWDPKLKKYRGWFTWSVLDGLGYDGGAYVSAAADANANGVLTFDELFGYAYDQTMQRSLSALAGKTQTQQTAQCYPASCSWFGIFRK